ncbi:MAG TPA: hypothetical protein VKA46_22625 [Gemmataceae bacterium]|nr:hypothetical protein [Gemmataceae bacterium]
MPTDVLSCPYCNAAAEVPAGTHPGQRIPCPRCGESFPYRPPTDEGVTASPAPAPPPMVGPPLEPWPRRRFAQGPFIRRFLWFFEGPAPSTPRQFSNGQILLLLFGGMVGIALIALVFALSTSGIRREYDVHLPKTRAFSVPIYVVFPLGVYVLGLIAAWFWGWNRRDRQDRTREPLWRRLSVLYGLSVLVLIVVELAVVVMHARAPRPAEAEGSPPVSVVAPAELAALGYLPDDTDLIFAVHAAELLDDPLGRDLVWFLGDESINLHSVEGWSGLKLEEIDHAVFGLTLDESLPVRFTLVVRTRRPIDRDQVLKALKAEKQRDVDGRPVYPFVMKTNHWLFRELGANAWFADDHTLVVAKKFEDGPGHRVPTEPRAGLGHLRPALRGLITERIRPPAQAWVAGRLPPRDDQFAGLKLLLQDRDNAPLEKVKTFGLWVTADPKEATLRAAFDCDDAEAVEALATYLGPDNRKGLKAWFAPGQGGPMGREFAWSLKMTRQGTWLELQAKASAEAIRKER